MKTFLHLLSFLLLLVDVNSAKASSKAAVAVKNEPRELTSVEMAAAGAFATAAGVILVHPIDTIKTLQQSGEGVGLSMIAATNKIMKVCSIEY
jgi:hypothetical protein